MHYHLKLNTYYRFGYTNLQSKESSHAYDRFPTNQASVDAILRHLANLEREYPRHTFWIETSKDGENWSKLTNSKYALFSED